MLKGGSTQYIVCVQNNAAMREQKEGISFVCLLFYDEFPSPAPPDAAVVAVVVVVAAVVSLDGSERICSVINSMKRFEYCDGFILDTSALA